MALQDGPGARKAPPRRMRARGRAAVPGGNAHGRTSGLVVPAVAGDWLRRRRECAVLVRRQRPFRQLHGACFLLLLTVTDYS